jgi:nucleoside-diphosphate-sugar epimerase
MRSNLLGTIEALEFCRRHGARLVFLSSYMYGEPERLPIDETAPVIARNPYALSKKLAEDACRFYAESFGTSVTVFRPFNVYGPGQAEPFLVPFIARQIWEGKEIRVKDLAPRRDYVYVQDVVDGIVSGAEQGLGYQLFNLGSGQSHSVEELIAAMQLVSGSALPVTTAGERRPEEIMDTVADISAARRAFGWTPGYSLRDGLALTLAGAEHVRG